MKKRGIRTLFYALAVVALAVSVQSCLDDDDPDYTLLRPTALVTVIPASDGSFTLQLDNTTALRPSNVKTSPYGDKEVRALVNYSDDGSLAEDGLRSVHINWMDSIRTKLPVPSLGEEDDETYGNDPIEIVRDWVTVAEDGYLTLRIRTRWGGVGAKHYINLLTGTNPDDPYELELRQDAKGDIYGEYGDALIAFNLNDLPRGDGDDVKIKLRWNSYSGEKSTEFDLYLRPDGDDNSQDENLDAALCSKLIE